MWTPISEGLVRVMSWVPLLQKTLSNGPSNALPGTPHPLRVEIPGGIPLSFCDVSRPTDLFNITMVQLSKQPGPIYMYGTRNSNKQSFLRMFPDLPADDQQG